MQTVDARYSGLHPFFNFLRKMDAARLSHALASNLQARRNFIRTVFCVFGWDPLKLSKKILKKVFLYFLEISRKKQFFTVIGSPLVLQAIRNHGKELAFG